MNVKTRRIKPQHKVKRAKNLARNLALHGKTRKGARTKKNHTTPMAKDTWALMDAAAKYWGVE